MMTARASRHALALMGAILAAAGSAAAQSPTITFHLAADSSTAIPGGSGSFTTFFSSDPFGHAPGPCISGGTISFFGAGSGGQQGIYTAASGSALKIADLGTAIPEGTGDFTLFFDGSHPPSPCISSGNVVFTGAGSGGQQGIYLMTPPGPPNKVADLSTAIPGGSGSFVALPAGPPCISGKDVAFVGDGAGGQQGVYAMTPPGTPTLVADLGTAIPGGSGSFIAIPPGPPCIGGQNVAFLGSGSGGQTGVYAMFPPAPLTRVADTSTAIPGSAGQSFASFDTLAFDGSTVAWSGASPLTSDGSITGVYTAIPPGPPLRVADSNSQVPGGLGNFVGFGAVALDSGTVAFEGLSKDAGGAFIKGLYTNFGGTLTKVIAMGDLQGAKTVSELHLGPGGFSGGQLAFFAGFTDGSQSVASATLSLCGTEKPAITCPANVAAATRAGQTTALVSYPAPAVVDACPAVTVSCAPASGSAFAVGSTSVTCTAQSSGGVASSCSFSVSVAATPSAVLRARGSGGRILRAGRSRRSRSATSRTRPTSCRPSWLRPRRTTRAWRWRSS